MDFREVEKIVEPGMSPIDSPRSVVAHEKEVEEDFISKVAENDLSWEASTESNVQDGLPALEEDIHFDAFQDGFDQEDNFDRLEEPPKVQRVTQYTYRVEESDSDLEHYMYAPPVEVAENVIDEEFGPNIAASDMSKFDDQDLMLLDTIQEEESHFDDENTRVTEMLHDSLMFDDEDEDNKSSVRRQRSIRNHPKDTSTSTSTSVHGTNCQTRSLYEELHVMLENSLMAYVLAFARRKARETNGEIFANLLSLPISKKEIFESFFSREKDVQQILVNSHIAKTAYHLDLEQLYSMYEIRARFPDSSFMNKDSEHQFIVEAGDCHQMDELVYFISVDHSQQEVCVIFRGSVTAKDWEADLEAAMTRFDVENESVKSHVSKVQIHTGFAKYILKQSPPKSKSQLRGRPRNCASMIESPSKIDFILQQTQDILRENPTYGLSTTGHSLGGALSTLFAAKAARIESIRKPIVCINFGSPKVGNSFFRKAVSIGEEHGLIRHLRVINHFDPVPKVPTRAYRNDLCCFCRYKNLYSHVGAKLDLNKSKDIVKISYNRSVNSPKEYATLVGRNMLKTARYLGWWFTEGGWGYYGLRAHSCLDYYTLLEEKKDALLKATMTQIYDSIKCRDKTLDEIDSSKPLVDLRVSLLCNESNRTSLHQLLCASRQPEEAAPRSST